MTSMDVIRDQLRLAMRHTQTLRTAQPTRKSRVYTVPELAGMPTRAFGEPDPEGTPASAYKSALRFWAEQVAPQIDSREFEELCWWAKDNCLAFKGDHTRFLENLFEMLTLKDGQTVAP